MECYDHGSGDLEIIDAYRRGSCKLQLVTVLHWPEKLIPVWVFVLKFMTLNHKRDLTINFPGLTINFHWHQLANFGSLISGVSNA